MAKFFKTEEQAAAHAIKMNRETSGAIYKLEFNYALNLWMVGTDAMLDRAGR